MNLVWVVPGVVLLAGLVAAWLIAGIRKSDTGTAAMQEIAAAIRAGAYAFLGRQYKTIGILSVLVAIILYFVDKMDWHLPVAFLAGALLSALSGYIGMSTAVTANLRVAAGARHSFNRALQTAFRGGAITGLAVTGLSLLGVFALFYAYGGASDPTKAVESIVGFGFGASFVALFAQLGGGIYTKAADVGADLVGKVEAGIPEDDPRNPAVVADLVGDNVGDCAGRGADLFESTAAENIGAMVLGLALTSAFGTKGILFPLVAGALGLLASIIGILVVRARENEDPMAPLNRGYLVTSVLVAGGLALATKSMLGEHWLNFYLASLVGLVLSYLFVWLTQYYTEWRFRPVKEIAQASITGPATNIISGLAVGMEATALPVLCIAAAIYAAYSLGDATGLAHGGFYGTAVATVGMLSTVGYILAMDTYGPITDNAGGIVEMSGAPEEIRNITDKLDASGNTTKALTKGYAVGSASLAAFLLFSAYVDAANLARGGVIKAVDLAKPTVFIGAFVGAMLVFLFASTAIRAVGKAAQSVIEEVRRQFRAKPGIMEGTEKPDYAAAVSNVTSGALKQMVLPGALVVATPVLVGVLLGPEAAAGFLMVATITGVIMALFLNTGGGAWDNAKKYIETGALGGKRSEPHKAAVVGDTVGDPFKDTAGPSLHVLIKLISTVTLVLAGLFVALH